MFTLKYVILMVLLGLAGSAVASEEVRQADHNRVVLELPSFNFTRLYNDINLGRFYNRLFNSTKEKEKEVDPAVTPKETVEQQQSVVTQTLGLPLLQNDYQIVNTPQAINGFYNPSLVLAALGTPSNALNNIGSQTANGLPLLNAPAVESGRQFGPGFGYGQGPNYGFGYGPGSNYGYPYAFSLINSIRNANMIPGLRVQQLAPWELNEVYYNLFRNRRYRGYPRPGYGSPYRPPHFGSRIPIQGLESLQFGQEDANSFSLDGDDEFYDDEVDSYDEENEVDYDEGDGYDEGFGDELEDVDGLWRKADADKKTTRKTKSKAKQHKSNKRLKKRKEQQQQQEEEIQSRHRSKRITY